MEFGTYLSQLDRRNDKSLFGINPQLLDKTASWLDLLNKRVEASLHSYNSAAAMDNARCMQLFNNWTRTEELKAWYSSPEDGDLFQGTSISSLTVPGELEQPLNDFSIDQLEDLVAQTYIKLHDKYALTVKNAICEDVSHWLGHGLFYGIVLPSKIISQAFGLAIAESDVVFNVDGHLVDPHEILTYPSDVRARYFQQCKDRIACFGDLNIAQHELEAALVMADISKPNIAALRDRILLAPIRCNEICSILATNIADRIRKMTHGRIAIRSLNVTIFDTDTPYTVHKIEHHLGSPMAPVLPGLIVQGTSGTIDAFRWLYAYRVSLIAQKMMKGSLYSQVKNRFTPFIFTGVLVPRDADILLDMEHLNVLRYRGNLSPRIEYLHLRPKLVEQLATTGDEVDIMGDMRTRWSL